MYIIIIVCGLLAINHLYNYTVPSLSELVFSFPLWSSRKENLVWRCVKKINKCLIRLKSAWFKCVSLLGPDVHFHSVFAEHRLLLHRDV